jgi:hypothetical protein
MGDIGGRSQAERNRSRAAALLFLAAAVVLVVPAVSAYGEWRHALHDGWPGPITEDIAALNAGEAVWKAGAWSVLVLVVLVGVSIAAGFAARAARQRVWLVVLVGVGATVVALLVVAVLLTPPLASS